MRRYVPASDVIDADQLTTRTAIVSGYIRATLVKEGLPLPPLDDPARRAIENAFVSRWCDLCYLAHDRYRGDGRTSIPLPDAGIPLTAEAQRETPDTLPLLSQACTSWARQKRALDPGSDKTITTFETTIGRFIELFGDLPSPSVTIDVRSVDLEI